MLDGLLTLNGVANVVETFVVDELLQSVALGESLDRSRTVFVRTAWKIGRYADIENAIAFVGNEVHEAARHSSLKQDVDGRDKPGHDVEMSYTKRQLSFPHPCP
jgi:hypothetical protein